MLTGIIPLFVLLLPLHVILGLVPSQACTLFSGSLSLAL